MQRVRHQQEKKNQEMQQPRLTTLIRISSPNLIRTNNIEIKKI